MKVVASQFASDNINAKLNPGLNGQPIQNQIRNVAAAFVDLQQARHEADYNTARRFTRREALDLVEQAEQAFRDWKIVRGTVQADTFLVGLLSFKNMRG
jgi:hypothetical protein